MLFMALQADFKQLLKFLHWCINLPKHAIVRQISASYTSCISFHPLRHHLNLEKARDQHSLYVKTLQELGLEIIDLFALNKFPDSCFVEDTAVLHKSNAVITRMGAISRRGEGESIATILKDYFHVSTIQEPGTIEGGDVVHLPDKLLSGVSQRTNSEGILQASSFLGVQIDTITDPAIIHLKSHISYLNDETLLVTSKYADHSSIEKYEKMVVPQSEEYATNVLSINGTVIMPNGFPQTHHLLQDHDFDIILLNTSEIEKCQGALTCLSLVW